MRIRQTAGALLAAVVIAACQPADTSAELEAADPDLIEDGRQIAERNCAVCHAIGKDGDSPNGDAPPLRTVLADFDIEALATDFREHIALGNEVMPEFDFGPLGTDALMAYLLTIEELPAEE